MSIRHELNEQLKKEGDSDIEKVPKIGADLIIAVIELVEVSRMICEQVKA